MTVRVRIVIKVWQDGLFNEWIVRDQWFDGINRCFSFGDIMNMEIGRNVYPFYMATLGKEFSLAFYLPPFCFAECLAQFKSDLLTISDYHDVKKLSNRLRIKARGSSSDDEGIALTPFYGEKGDT